MKMQFNSTVVSTIPFDNQIINHTRPKSLFQNRKTMICVGLQLLSKQIICYKVKTIENRRKKSKMLDATDSFQVQIRNQRGRVYKLDMISFTYSYACRCVIHTQEPPPPSRCETRGVRIQGVELWRSESSRN